MTNLEAKQEAIKRAYGEENYNFFKGIIGENGWIGLSRYDFEEDLESEKKFDKMISEIEFEESFEDEQVFYRPKSLQGIEINNGWIRIDDFVKYTDEKFWIFNSHINDLYQGQLFDDDMFPINRYATHYKPIEKPKLPIY